MTQKRNWRLANLPEGYSPDDLREFELVAQVQAGDADAEMIALAAETTKVAGPPLINADGRPTILKVVAWMLHTDVVNKNGDYFVKEEIEAMAPTLFRAPNLGVMDWNHAAVLNYNDDPPLIGVWYKSEFAFDQAALDGQGAWGLLVTGMMFAWLFPEQANEMLADQARDGGVRFSMAAIPSSTEFRTIGGAKAAVLHNPVFFTNSALNKPPADPDALGTVSERPEAIPEEMVEEWMKRKKEKYPVEKPGYGKLVTVNSLNGLTSTTTGTYLVDAETTHWLFVPHTAAITEEKAMNDEMIAALKAEKEAAEAKIDALTAKLTLAESIETERAELAEQVAALNEKIVALETTVAEITTSRDALIAERDQAIASFEASEARIAELSAQVDAFEAEKAAFEEEAARVEAARVLAEKLAARLASLPVEFMKVHSARDEATRTRLETKWVAFETDEEWEEYKKHELLGYTPAQPRLGYRQRSEQEGTLVNNEVTPGLRDKLAAVIKK